MGFQFKSYANTFKSQFDSQIEMFRDLCLLKGGLSGVKGTNLRKLNYVVRNSSMAIGVQRDCL